MKLYKRDYKDAHGRRRRCTTWSVDYTLGGRRHRVPLHVRDRRAAEVLAADLVRRQEQQAAGVDPYQETRQASPEALIEQYAEELARRGCTRKHVRTQIPRLRRLFDGIPTLARFDAAKLRERLGALTTAGTTPRTVAAYRVACSGFFKWLLSEDRWPSNPCLNVRAPRVAEKTFQRRALTPEEAARLLDAAPPDRALVYAVALGTGLRRGELARLTWQDLDLSEERPTLRVRAASAKNRREAVLPLSRDLAHALRAQARPGGRVFDRIPNTKTLRRDLEAAGIEAENAQGRVDLHALRVTLATSLAQEGVPLTTAQELLRHCDPKLTSATYTKLRVEDLRGAVESLCRPLCRNNVREDSFTPSYARIDGVTGVQQTTPVTSQKIAGKAGKGATDATDAAAASGAPPRTRTWNLRIKNPLLCQLS